MVFADLHIHTTTSDGTLTIETLPEAAREAGVEAIAVTDHDRLNPSLSDPITEIDGVTIITGIELRVDPGPDQDRIDLLGYAVDPTPALSDEIERLQTDRVERGAAIRDRLETHLGVTLDISIQPGIGRPHLAQAVVDHPDTDYTTEGAVFADLIGEDGPCFVPRAVTSYRRGRELLTDACAVVSLAHPYRYADPATALELTADLDAVERYYPYDSPVDQSLVESAIDEYDLLVTGGSDAHDTQLGRAGLSEAAYREFRQALPGP